MNKLALSVISRGKNEELSLDRALQSAAPFVDKIFITLTEPEKELEDAIKICQRYGAEISFEQAKYKITQKDVDWLKKFFNYEPHVKVGDKIFLFDKARNFNLSQIPKEYTWFMWIDDDDIVLNGKNIRKFMEMADQQNIDAVYFNYIYQADLEGNKIKNRVIEHLRERLIRNNDRYKWLAPIHETLVDQAPNRSAPVPAREVEILHLSTDQDKIEALQRNIKNLEYAILISKGEDPRQIYYLAKALFDMRTPDYDEKAKPLILRYIYGDENGDHKSGWAEERQQAFEYLSEIYERKGDNDKSLKASLDALVEPGLPRTETFLRIAKSQLLKGNNEIALFWVKQAMQIEDVQSTLVKNPRDMQLKALEIIFNASLQLSKVDDVWAAAIKLKEIAPNDPNVSNAFTFAKELRMERDMSKNFVETAQYLDQVGEKDKLVALLQSAPAIIQKNPFYQQIAQQVMPPREWDENEIGIWCGIGFTDWSPKRLSDPQGSFIGGSEEAVIKLAEALTKKGWKVTVYNTPGADEGTHNDVTYLAYYKFNPQDQFNILIGWRQFLPDVAAKKKYYWAHDILNTLDFTQERLDKLDKVIVLSDYHRKTLPNVPDEKIMLSSNGI